MCTLCGIRCNQACLNLKTKYLLCVLIIHDHLMRSFPKEKFPHISTHPKSHISTDLQQNVENMSEHQIFRSLRFRREVSRLLRGISPNMRRYYMSMWTMQIALISIWQKFLKCCRSISDISKVEKSVSALELPFTCQNQSKNDYFLLLLRNRGKNENIGTFALGFSTIQEEFARLKHDPAVGALKGTNPGICSDLQTYRLTYLFSLISVLQKRYTYSCPSISSIRTTVTT